MAIKSPVQGSRVVPPSSPQGRLQREIHSIQRRCQETLRRAKVRKVEMEQEEARRRVKMEGFRTDIEENKRLREEAKLKEEERKRKEEKKFRLEMKKDVEKMIKGVEEARKDFKKLFRPTVVPRVHVAVVSNADSASIPSSVTQNDQAAPVPVPVPVPVLIHSQGEKNDTNIEKAPAVPVLSHQACAPVLVVSDSEGEKEGRENMKKLINASVRVSQACATVPVVSDSQWEKKGRENMKKLSNVEMEAPAIVMNGQLSQRRPFQELDLDICQEKEEKKMKQVKEVKEEKRMKQVKVISDMKSTSLIHNKKIRIIEFCDFYTASFKLTMDNLEKSFVEEAKEDDGNSFDSFLESFSAPKWVDFCNLTDEENDIASFCPNDCSQNGVTSNEEDNEGYFDEFLDSFNAPKWVDFANLNDHYDDNDDIGFFGHSDCSKNLWP